MTNSSYPQNAPQPPAPGQYASHAYPQGDGAGAYTGPGYPVQGQPTPPPAKSGKNKGLIIAASVVGAAALVFGGMAIAGGNEDPGQGSTSGPVVTEPATPAPTPAPESTSGSTDLTGLTAAETQAIVDFETAYGVDLDADGEAVILNDAYICIEQYASGWTFDEIYDDNMAAYEGDEALSADIMVIAFDYLAPQYAADFDAWAGF